VVPNNIVFESFIEPLETTPVAYRHASRPRPADMLQNIAARFIMGRAKNRMAVSSYSPDLQRRAPSLIAR
jgi:hypothetical protein